MNEISKEKIQWLHDAATEFASTGMKMTMNPDTVLQLTTPLLALRERAEPVSMSDDQIHDYLQAQVNYWHAEAMKYREMTRIPDPQPTPVVPDMLWKMDHWRGAPCNGVEWAKGYQAGWNKYHQWLGERRAAMLAAPPAPEGWVLVPKEATQEMCDSVLGRACFTDDGSGARYIFEKMLQHAPKFNLGWIACSERMPETEGHYLVWAKASKLDGYCDHQAMATYQGGEWSNDFNWLVTHWMPLPEPPH